MLPSVLPSLSWFRDVCPSIGLPVDKARQYGHCNTTRSIVDRRRLSLRWKALEVVTSRLLQPPYNSGDKLSNTTQDNFGRSRNVTWGAPAWSPTAGVGLNTLPPTDFQRSRALRGSITVVLDRFPGVLREFRGPLALLNLLTPLYRV